MPSKHLVLASFVAAALVSVAPQARASTLAVTGGNGLDLGELCPTTNFTCPATTALGDTQLSLAGTDPVTGSFSYNSSLNELSFSLTLTQNVTFTDGTNSEVLQAGSTFSANNLMVSAPSGAGGTVTGSGGFGAASIYINSALVPGNGSVLIQSIDCTTSGPGQCGVELGGLSGGLNVDAIGGKAYIGELTFNVNVTPVPLPAGLPLLLSGLGFVAGALRRRLAH